MKLFCYNKKKNKAITFYFIMWYWAVFPFCCVFLAGQQYTSINYTRPGKRKTFLLVAVTISHLVFIRIGWGRIELSLRFLKMVLSSCDQSQRIAFAAVFLVTQAMLASFKTSFYACQNGNVILKYINILHCYRNEPKILWLLTKTAIHHDSRC